MELGKYVFTTIDFATRLSLQNFVALAFALSYNATTLLEDSKYSFSTQGVLENADSKNSVMAKKLQQSRLIIRNERMSQKSILVC